MPYESVEGEPSACRVLLIGMMGSGKSTIGRLLSEATGWRYMDNDELVRRSSGATARQILADRGEAEMREAESGALALGIATPAPVVIGVAAGTDVELVKRLVHQAHATCFVARSLRTEVRVDASVELT